MKIKPVDKLNKIKHDLAYGKIDYDIAKQQAIVPLKELNTEAEKIAKKFSRKHYQFTFASFMR